MSRNDDAVQFSEYSVAQLLKRRERFIKNSFAVAGAIKNKKPNVNSFEHLGYFIDRPPGGGKQNTM